MTSDQECAGDRQDRSPGNIPPTFQSIRELAEALQTDPPHSPADDRTLRILREESLRQDLDFQKALAEQKRAQTEEIRQTQELREKYAKRVYTLLKWWVFVAILLLVLDALDPPALFKDIPWIDRLIPAFDIETKIMLAFLAGTTVAVVGLVLAVVKGLFPGSSKN